jgi:hypothetical protein
MSELQTEISLVLGTVTINILAETLHLKSNLLVWIIPREMDFPADS